MNNLDRIDNVDIICMTGGKCGSTTLLTTFINNGFKSIKAHYIADFENQYGYDGLIDLINESSSKKKIYLIDSYRTPIERKISSFFQNIQIYVPDYKEKSCEELISIFNENYLDTLEEYHSINSIMQYYGLNPFKKFNFKKRFVKKNKGNIVFIKILFSDINNWNIILSKIFKRNITLHSANLTKNKEEINLYNEFKQKYRVPIKYLKNKLINDREFKIFNTLKKKKMYMINWVKKSFE